MRQSLLIIFLLFISCSKKEKDNVNSSIIENTKWRLYNSKDSIPKQLNEFLFVINGETKIANPNEEFEVTDNIVNDTLPTRQLQLLARKNNEWRMTYIQGGFGKSYIYLQCKIQNDSIINLKKGYSFKSSDNNDSIEKYLKERKLNIRDIKITYK
jgi:hypothetical protein